MFSHLLITLRDRYININRSRNTTITIIIILFLDVLKVRIMV